MALRDRLRKRLSDLKQGAERLRDNLRSDERVEERGWDRGWSPQSSMTGASSGQGRGTRDSATGGPLRDVPFADPQSLNTWAPAAAALSTYEAGQTWDLTRELTVHWTHARAQGQKTILLACTLSHCGWSDRTVQALVGSKPLWDGQAMVAVARAGDRLQKVYFRDLLVSGVEITIPTFPTTLAFDVTPTGLTLGVVAFDPLGPDPDHAKVMALLEGESVVPEGSDHFFVVACSGMICTRIDSASGFVGQVEIRLNGV